MLKRLALAFLSQPTVVRVLTNLRPTRYAVFMLHRFRTAHDAPDAPQHGRHDAGALHNVLTALRAGGINTVSLDSLVAGLVGAAPLPRGPAVAFTVDDCYPDFADVAVPVFRSHGCPVTGFIVPHVIDGTTWFWWDQVQYIRRHAKAQSLSVQLEERPVTLS